MGDIDLAPLGHQPGEGQLMARSDAANLLAAASAIDNRTVTREQAQEWAYALRGLDPAECLDAIRAIRGRNSGEYLVPGLVRDEVVAARRRRAYEAKLQRYRAVLNGEVTATEDEIETARYVLLERDAFQQQASLTAAPTAGRLAAAPATLARRPRP